jgi:hypothetical protein
VRLFTPSDIQRKLIFSIDQRGITVICFRVQAVGSLRVVYALKWTRVRIMLTALLQAIGSFAAAAIAWITLEFFGRPLRKFYDLRGEAICLLAQTGNVRARYKEIRDTDGFVSENVEQVDLSNEEIADLKEAKKILRDLASRFRAFAANETYAVRFVRWCKYDPMKASGGLFGLSNGIETSGGNKASQKKSIEDALRIPNF